MQGLSARIFNIRKFCTHNGPGLRTTVFFKGCPMRCKWCSHPESQSAKTQIFWNASKCVQCMQCINICPKMAILSLNGKTCIRSERCDGCAVCVNICPSRALTLSGRSYTLDQVVNTCLQDKAYYESSGGGVTLSGGEPLMQYHFAEAFLQIMKAEGIHTALETAGYTSPDIFSRILPLTDLFLFDIKHHSHKAHYKGTGTYNDLILQNLRTAAASGKEVLARIPVIPVYNNSLQDARRFAELFLDMGVRSVQLIPFHQTGSYRYAMLGVPYEMGVFPTLRPDNLRDYQQVFLQNNLHCFF